MLFWIWTLVIITASWLYFRRTYSSFTRRGVKCQRALPLVGNMWKIVLRKHHFSDDIEMLYNMFPDERFVGRYEFLKEIVMLRDLELIKRITIKDFEHFLDHRTIINPDTEKIFGRNLFSLKGQEWKDMRSTLSPAFTSSKMRLMLPFMVDVGNHMIEVIKKKIQSSSVGYIDIECKDLSTRYANDVIASCAFGLKVDSHNEEENEFYKMGKLVSTFSFRQLLVFFGYGNFPTFMKILKLKMFSQDSINYFKNIVLNTMQDRELQHIIRPDMIHLLMEAKKGKLTHEDKNNDTDAGFATVEESSIGKKDINRVWTDEDLVAQAILFFIAGFETVSSAMSFVLHELALNPDVQDRLAEEIKLNDTKNGGKFDYNSIQNLTYLDMVISESLRLWPPLVTMERLCIKDYNLGKPNSKAKDDFIVKEGTAVYIPAWAFHHNPQYFPDPLKFDPERFSEENKHKIKPLTYIPFGLGPRNCIGSRFALCEVKVMVYQILQHMVLSPCEKTCIPSKLTKETLNLRLEGGHWIRFKIRQ